VRGEVVAVQVPEQLVKELLKDLGSLYMNVGRK
jgi:hypothetical protein